MKFNSINSRQSTYLCLQHCSKQVRLQEARRWKQPRTRKWCWTRLGSSWKSIQRDCRDCLSPEKIKKNNETFINFHFRDYNFGLTFATDCVMFSDADNNDNCVSFENLLDGSVQLFNCGCENLGSFSERCWRFGVFGCCQHVQGYANVKRCRFFLFFWQLQSKFFNFLSSHVFITHHCNQTLKISDLIEEFFVVLVCLWLQELNFLDLGFLELSKRCHYFFVDFFN